MSSVQKWRRSMIYKYEINQTPTFEAELQRIYIYIRFYLLEPTTAENTLKTIINKIQSLQYLPESFSCFNAKKNLRMLHVKKYVIIYEVDNKSHKVFILHIYHSSQNYFDYL